MKELYVGNLPTEARDDDVRDLFKPYSGVESVKVINKSDRPSIAFVVFYCRHLRLGL